jgi:hypothetical protein
MLTLLAISSLGWLTQLVFDDSISRTMSDAQIMCHFIKSPINYPESWHGLIKFFPLQSMSMSVLTVHQ